MKKVLDINETKIDQTTRQKRFDVAKKKILNAEGFKSREERDHYNTAHKLKLGTLARDCDARQVQWPAGEVSEV